MGTDLMIDMHGKQMEMPASGNAAQHIQQDYRIDPAAEPDDQPLSG
jgi:hypothetical protein